MSFKIKMMVIGVAVLSSAGSTRSQEIDRPVLQVTEENIVPLRLPLLSPLTQPIILAREHRPNQDWNFPWYLGEKMGESVSGMRMDRSGRIPRYAETEHGKRDRLYSKFSFDVFDGRAESSPVPLLPPRYIEDMSAISPKHFPYPEVASKKGLQVQMVDDAIALGVKHAALNVTFNTMLDWNRSPSAIPFEMDGRTFLFRRDQIEDLDRRVKTLSDAGMIVYLILLNYKGTGSAEGDRIIRHPKYNDDCPNNLGMFNTVTDEGVEHYKAVCEFLFQRYTRPDQKHGRALNFIIGNEVNSHWWWSNMGEVSMEEFLIDYQRAVRIASTAARKYCAVARVYISLEHHWSYAFTPNPKRCFPGRDFLDRFAARARELGDFPWHVAYHPYPENLGDPAFWEDTSAIDAYYSPRITFKNLHVLTNYMQREPLLYRGEPRRIILSEQGFHTPDGPEGEALQAAAYAYAWVKVHQLDAIDAFILHRHVDHGQEFGLKLGLWARDEEASFPAAPKRKKPIYDVFLKADTPEWREAFAFALPIVGLESWPEGASPEQEKEGH